MPRNIERDEKEAMRRREQLIPDLGYVYLNPYAPQPTWTYDEELKTWVYMEGAGRPYGSLYMAEWTPDGYYVNADGVWEPVR